MTQYIVQWDFWTWVNVRTFDDLKEAENYLKAMRAMFPLHGYRMIWKRVASQKASLAS